MSKNKTLLKLMAGYSELPSGGYIVCAYTAKGIEQTHFESSRGRAKGRIKHLTGEVDSKQCNIRVSKWVADFYKHGFLDQLFNFKGTDFQKKVWKQLSKIQFGKTISYQAIAKNINSPKAVRAVGTAVGKNPVFLFVPCHRVLPKSGGIGGFASGPRLKQKLLALEGVEM